MDRQTYNNCMIPFMKERQMCIGAKICTGKAQSREEAQKLCDEAALVPKPPKKARGKCKIDIAALADCIIKSLDGTEISQAKLAPIIASCTGQKVGKVETPTREKFIKKCFRENMVTGDIKEAQKLRTMCTARWKEQIQAVLIEEAS